MRARSWLCPSAALVTFISGALALGVGATACDVGDAICTDKTVEEDRNDHCPYGPPGGPQRTAAEKCEVAFDDTTCTYTFRDDVYPILIAPIGGAESGGGCTLQACHGPNGTGSIDLILPEAPTPDELYNALAGVQDAQGNHYLEEDDENAYILCNLTGSLGGGSAMPPISGLTNDPNTPDDDDHIDIITQWVKCGMKLDGTGTGGGGEGGAGGGAGGMGGEGGIGGGM